MWTSVALMTAMCWTPAQAGQLEVKNARFTYGILGQERKDSVYLPGDLVVLAYDIEGLKTAKDGSAKYNMTMNLFFNKKEKPVYSTVPQPMTVVNSLGGNRLPSFTLVTLFTDAEPGEYTMSVLVEDLEAKVKAKLLEHKFTVKPMEFGIVRTGFVYSKLNEEEAGGAPHLAPPLAVPGQNLMLNFAVVGYQVKGDKNQPNLEVTMNIEDEAGKAVLNKPFSGKATDVDEEFLKLKLVPFLMPIQANRSGKFKIIITAEDKHAGKTAKLTLDLKVVELN